MSTDDLDIEAGLKRDHDLRITTMVLRYVGALVALVIACCTYRCDPTGEADVQRARAQECRAAHD